MKMMKRGQHEIMGLAVVIILIIIGLLYTAKFSSNKGFSYGDYKQSELASGMLTTLLATTSRDCNGLSLKEILQDCADNNGDMCNGKNSCAYFEQQANEIFGNTLGTWKTNYRFRVFYNEDPIIELGTQCINKESEMLLLPTKTGVLSVKLDICR